MNTDRTNATLQKIAALLDLPTSAFHTAHRPIPGDSSHTTLRQTAELLEAFATITDPNIRRDCIAFVQSRRPTTES